MFLIVGLGNPESDYRYTRHNIGFIAIDVISNQCKVALSSKAKFHADLVKTSINDHDVILCKPDTYMNLSGKAVAAIASYYKIPSNKIIVLHDDIDLGLGVIKCKIGGGHGGHNGLKSIDAAIGSAEYYRVRIGVGRPENPNIEVSDYVLGKFTDDELMQINTKLCDIADGLNLLLDGKLEIFKKKLSSR